MSSVVDRISDAIADADAMLGRQAERRALAADLAAEGWTEGDVAIAAQIAAHGAEDAAAVLVSRLSDEDRRRDLLDDIQARRDRSRPHGQAPSGPRDGEPDAEPGSAEESWDHNRNSRIAYAIIHIDKSTPKVAAGVIGCCEVEAKAMADEERDRRRAEHPEKRLVEDETHEQRIARFRDMMNEKGRTSK